MFVFCHKCQDKVSIEGRKLSFREECPKCGFDLHVCENCKFYSLGKPNDCIIPNIELVRDKEKYNFCEEFVPLKDGLSQNNNSTSDASKKLFGDEDPDSKTTSFDDLFNS